MSINFSNFPYSDTFNVKNITKKRDNVDVSFKGNETNGAENVQGNIPSCSHTAVKVHPLIALNMQLLKDAYSMEQINEHSIFLHRMINIDFGNPIFLEAAKQGLIKKDSIFSESIKSNEDISAMQKAYLSLREKFNTQDVREHVDKMRKLEAEIAQFLIKKGHDLPQESKYSAKAMILSVLHYVNKENEPLLQKLLNDKNFNNIYLDKALMSFEKNKDMSYGMKVLEMAQTVGYDKEFSFALSVLISEAKEENMPIIEKILEEQDFFAGNDSFVSNELINFVRHPHSGLAPVYIQNDDITLNEIQELLNIEDENED